MHFCPHSHCDYRGWLGLNNLRANGHPSGGPWRQFHCTSCDGYFPEHHGTIFHGKQAAVELIVRVLACWPKGSGIRATARVFEVDANTVLHWLVEAAEQLRAFSAYFLCDLHVEQLQLDELYAVLRDLKAGEISEDEAIKRLERSPYWVWTAMDPTEQVAAGDRCGDSHPGDGPACGASGRPALGTGLCPAVFDRWPQGLRHGLPDPFWPVDATGTASRQRSDAQPRWMPLPELLYAQVVKSYRRRRIVGVKYRVVFGTMERVAAGAVSVRPQDQYSICRAPQPRHPPAGGSGGASGQHAVSGRGRLTPAAGTVSSVSQFLLAPRQFASAVAGSRSHQRLVARPSCGGRAHRRWRRG